MLEKARSAVQTLLRSRMHSHILRILMDLLVDLVRGGQRQFGKLLLSTGITPNEADKEKWKRRCLVR
jgi:hypothetical protein